MAHNWTTKTIADFPSPANKFTVVTGDDTLGNGLPDNSYRSIPQGVTVLSGSGNKLVVGTGGYTGSIALNIGGLVGEYLKAKQTIVNLDGGTMTIFNIGITTLLQDLTVKNGSVVSYSFQTYTRCTFIDCNITLADAGIFTTFNECEFINCQIGNTGVPSLFDFSLCKFFNSTVSNLKNIVVNHGCRKLESCYVDSFSRVQFRQETGITELNFNDIEGQLMFQDGTNPDVYVGLTQALSEHPTVVGSRNINVDPLFADVSKMALTISNSSPLIGASKTNGNIGNAFRADTYFCQSSTQLRSTLSGGTALITGMDGTTDLTVTPGFFVGTIRTGVFTISASILSELGAIQYIGKYALDSSLGGTANSQVPDASGYTGISPNNLSYKLRYSTGSTPPSPTVNGDWDNGGLIAAGDFFDMVWNIQPQIDGLARGNADEAFESSTAGIVACKWIQLEINIIEDSWNN